MNPSEELSAFIELQASASLIAKDLAFRAGQAAEADKLREELDESARNLEKTLEANGSLSARVAELEAKLKASEDEGAAKDKKILDLDAEFKEYKSRASATLKRLREERNGLTKKVDKVTQQAKDAVVQTHLEAFGKEIRQAWFLGFDPKDFNVDYDIFEGRMVPLEELPEGYNPTKPEGSELPSTPTVKQPGVTLEGGEEGEEVVVEEPDASVQGEENAD